MCVLYTKTLPKIKKWEKKNEKNIQKEIPKGNGVAVLLLTTAESGRQHRLFPSHSPI